MSLHTQKTYEETRWDILTFQTQPDSSNVTCSACNCWLTAAPLEKLAQKPSLISRSTLSCTLSFFSCRQQHPDSRGFYQPLIPSPIFLLKAQNFTESNSQSSVINLHKIPRTHSIDLSLLEQQKDISLLNFSFIYHSKDSVTKRGSWLSFQDIMVQKKQQQILTAAHKEGHMTCLVSHVT